MQRLHPDTLATLSPEVQTPAYDRRALRPGILHLGIGAFHRAHQAVYTDDALAASGGHWGIVGVSLRSATVAQQLNPQSGLYSVLAEDADQRELRVVGAIQRVLVAPENPAAVTAAIADPAIRIVTLSITEKGYGLAADGASLDADDAAIAQDLAQPGQAGSAIGLLALGLRARYRNGAAPLTLISCDNLAQNSLRLQGVLSQYLRATFPEVLPWLDDAVAFACSMVDRIVPATTPEQQLRQSRLLGLDDAGAVRTEPFSQWVIEDRFATERPDWASAGVRFVSAVAPFEAIKLRVLNAAHTAIACEGLLQALPTVDAVMAEPAAGKRIERLMREELAVSLPVPEGFDMQAYCDALLARFANPCLGHRCAQIAMDSSEKIAQRWLPALRGDGDTPLLVQALASWLHLVLDTQVPIDDPRAERLLALRAGGLSREQRVVAALACARITAGTLPRFESLVAELQRNLDNPGAARAPAVTV
ncbi:MAG: mannitol dehydrogenase family protein [Halioglobus sp.]|nr:mannitol dehydrogenase family protein [Halioglobus sp.]